MTGPAASAADSVKIFKGIDSTLLYATLGVVIVLLLLTYRSPILWLLPIISAGVALTVAEAVIYLLTRHRPGRQRAERGILVVLVLGAGTDYALLLIARYREELRRHEDRHEAMAVALRRAGPAIMASGATVIAGMLCLLVADSADISGLGPVAAIGIAVGLIAMITLLPALLVIFGRWVFWPIRPRYGSAEPTASGLWARVGQRHRRPAAARVGGHRGAAGCASLGLIGFTVGALTQAQSFRGTPSVGGGRAGAGPALPGRRGRAGRGDRQRGAARRCAPPWRDPGIAAVSPPLVRDGLVYLQGTLACRRTARPRTARSAGSATPCTRFPAPTPRWAGPPRSTWTWSSYAIRDRNVIIPLVLVVVLIILGLLLRAVVAPLVLIGTVILSFGAALGLSALAFKHLFGFAGADTSMPLFASCSWSPWASTTTSS